MTLRRAAFGILIALIIACGAFFFLFVGFLVAALTFILELTGHGKTPSDGVAIGFAVVVFSLQVVLTCVAFAAQRRALPRAEQGSGGLNIAAAGVLALLFGPLPFGVWLHHDHVREARADAEHAQREVIARQNAELAETDGGM